jgi:hypothetical protein
MSPFTQVVGRPLDYPVPHLRSYHLRRLGVRLPGERQASYGREDLRHPLEPRCYASRALHNPARARLLHPLRQVPLIRTLEVAPPTSELSARRSRPPHLCAVRVPGTPSFEALILSRATAECRRLPQVHEGLYTEWPRTTGNIHPVSQSARNTWLALVIVCILLLSATMPRDLRSDSQVFWVLWGIGMALLPRQWKQETATIAANKMRTSDEETEMH